MVVFPHAKINLGLNVLEKRQDGFHNIESVFYPVQLSDILEIIENEEVSENSVEMVQTGINTNCLIEDNLVFKAIQKIKKRYNIPPVKVHLHKLIPSGAGLGGGSADAAFTIKLLNQKFNLRMENAEMKKLADELGSDCPYFIEGGIQLVKGKGDILMDADLKLNNYFLVLIKPDIHIDTKNAYARIKPEIPEYDTLSILQLDVGDWYKNLKNDFEVIMLNDYPIIKKIKNELSNSGAIYSSMTGSGSAVFGIFAEKPSLKFSTDGMFVWSGKM